MNGFTTTPDEYFVEDSQHESLSFSMFSSTRKHTFLNKILHDLHCKIHVSVIHRTRRLRPKIQSTLCVTPLSGASRRSQGAQQSHAQSVNLLVHLTTAPCSAWCTWQHVCGPLLCRNIVARTGLNARYPVRNCTGPWPTGGWEGQRHRGTSCDRSLATVPLQRY